VKIKIELYFFKDSALHANCTQIKKVN